MEGVVAAELEDVMGSAYALARSSIRLPKNMMLRRDVEEPGIRRQGNSMLSLNSGKGYRNHGRTNGGIERPLTSSTKVSKGVQSVRAQ